jgi:hypothetical protein
LFGSEPSSAAASAGKARRSLSKRVQAELADLDFGLPEAAAPATATTSSSPGAAVATGSSPGLALAGINNANIYTHTKAGAARSARKGDALARARAVTAADFDL